MGNILVLYHSNSGNTANMAQYVADGVRSVENIELRFKTIDEADADDLRWCDGLALGSPTNLGTISWRMKQWWDELPPDLWSTIDGKIGCAFSSSGGWGGRRRAGLHEPDDGHDELRLSGVRGDGLCRPAIHAALRRGSGRRAAPGTGKRSLSAAGPAVGSVGAGFRRGTQRPAAGTSKAAGMRTISNMAIA